MLTIIYMYCTLIVALKHINWELKNGVAVVRLNQADSKVIAYCYYILMYFVLGFFMMVVLYLQSVPPSLSIFLLTML